MSSIYKDMKKHVINYQQFESINEVKKESQKDTFQPKMVDARKEDDQDDDKKNEN